MNIQQFKYVLSVFESKNFELAAEKCFVTQSTLSIMIAKLENELGIKIFNRKTKPVSVTLEGKKIIDRLQIINNEISQLDNLVQELKGEMKGEIKIGIIPTIAPYLLPLFLTDFSLQFPHIKIIIRELHTTEIIKCLKNRTLDIGILALPIQNKDLEEVELYKEPFLIYDCSGGKHNTKISINNIDLSKLWLLQDGHCLRNQVQRICEKTIGKNSNFQNLKFDFGSIESLLRFTKYNKGITILPYLSTLDFSNLQKDKLIEFKNPIPTRSVGLITHKYFVKKKVSFKLQKIIKNSISNLIPLIDNPDVISPI